MSVYQNLPDTYSVPVRSQINKASSNLRYKHFTQTHFTAGDEEQFYHYMINKPPSLLVKEEILDNHQVWSNYNISPESIKNTFSYMFYKFKKGLFIQIRNGKLVRFLPFSNAFYMNEWSDKINVPSNLRSDPNVLPIRYWYSNNGLVRYESPCNETDTGMCQMKHMFEQLCQTYHTELPDIDFFVNRRDFPLLKRDFTEPYDNIYNSETHPLVSHNYDKHIPVLSMCTTDLFADIPIPTMDDWSRVMFKEQIHFAMTKRVIATKDIFDTPWSKKKELAVFRGSNTGIGHTTENNIRLKLYYLFQNHPYCNVGISSWNSRHRKISGNPTLVVPKQTIQLSNSLSLEEQSSYKYIIHIQGHTQAFRLSIELAMKSVILIVKGKYRLWYESLLVPWEHYVPVAEDLSDLDEKIKWCLEHDDECQQIAIESRKFYDKHLSKEGCLSYLKDLLIELSQKCLNTYFPNYGTHTTPVSIERMYLKDYPFDSNIPGSTERSRTLSSLKGLKNKVNRNSRRKRTIFRNTNTEIIVIDDSYISKRNSKIIHEKFIGLYCINRVLRDIPNFVYTIPTPNENELLLEYVRGPSMFEYIKSKHFNFNEWIFLMLQTLLSISVAQRTCFFTHNDLNIWNIILTYYSTEQIHDYLVDVDDIYRVYSTIIPVIIDFDKSHAVYDLQSFTPYSPFSKYHDTLCLLVNSIYNILKYQKLSFSDEKNLLYLFKESLCDPIYCPKENIQTTGDLYKFLDVSHKFAHISFSNKGDLYTRTPMYVIKLLKTIYKPSYFGHTKIINLFDKVTTVEYRNAGKIHKSVLPVLPAGIHPFLELYYKQLFDFPCDRSTKNHSLDRINIPVLTDNDVSGVYDFPIKYLDYLNIFVELLCSGGKHQLSYEEKRDLLQAVQIYLNTRESIYTYSKHLINFKLQRNIL